MERRGGRSEDIILPSFVVLFVVVVSDSVRLF